MIRVAVVGCGDIANKEYLPALAGGFGGKAKLVALCDIVPERVQAAGEKLAVARRYRLFRDMLRDGGFDLLVVLTPLRTHHKFAGPALRAGFSVFTEKPLAPTAAIARSLVRLARRKRKMLASAPYPPATPLLERARDLVARGAIGKVTLSRAHSSHGGPDQYEWSNDPSWTFRRALGGPVPPMFDMGIYGLSVLTAVIGPVRRVSSFTGLGVPVRRIQYVQEKGFKPYTLRVDSHDNTMTLLDFGEGRFGALDASYCMRVGDEPERPYQFYGTEGALMLDTFAETMRIHSQHGRCGLPRGRWKEFHVPPRGANTFMQGLRHVLDCMRERRRPVIDGGYAAHLVEVLEGAIASARTGKAVRIG